jgi:hypothetical protein
MSDTFRALMYGVLILLAALIPMIVSLVDRLGG